MINSIKTLSLCLLCIVAAPGFTATDEQNARMLKAMADPARPDSDRQDDAGRKPNQVIDFAGIESGATVIDMMAGRGYYTEVLAAAVGPEGKVYLHNVQRSLERREGATQKAIDARLANNRLPNIETIAAEYDGLNMPGTADAVWFSLNIHDVINFRGEPAAVDTFKALNTLLKPGGVIAVIDHTGVAGADNKKLHRIEPRLVEDALRKAGFTLESSSYVLANPDDDHTLGVFDEGIRRKTDRFVIRARK